MHNSKLVQNARMWDEKTKNYPKFEPNLKFENQILDRVEGRAFKFDGLEVIDVGAGTGIYTLNIALRGARTLALDISEKMLRILENSARKYGVNGVETQIGDFRSADLPSCDAVTCFMSPALSDLASWERLVSLPRRGFCALGWAGLRQSEVLEAAFAACGTHIHAHYSFEGLREFLRARGFKFESEFFENTWVSERSFEDAVEDQAWHVRMHGDTPNPAKIAAALERFRDEGGNITEITKVRLELITCVF